MSVPENAKEKMATLANGFTGSCFQMIQVTSFVLMKVILYIAPAQIKQCQISTSRWPPSLPFHLHEMLH
jgi:hypothetical protein